MQKYFHYRYIIVVLVSLLIILSCTTRSAKRIKLLTESTSKQEYEKTIKTIRKSPNLYGELNQFLYWFDLGILFHYMEQYDSSLYHLEKAEAVLDDLYARSVLNEAASLLTNDNLRPYRARRYEQILLHQFLAFNYLAKNEYDEALVEMRKVHLIFDRFKSKDKGKDKYNDDGMAHFISSILYEAQGENDNGVISLYKSVSAYQNGPIPIPADVNDLAYYKLLQDNREDDIVKLNLEAGKRKEDVPGLYNNPQSEIIVIGYLGECAVLEETVFWGTYVVDGLLVVYYRNPQGDTVTFAMPAPPIPEREKEDKTLSGTTFHIKFALPSMVKRESSADRFIASIADTGTSVGESIGSILLSDTDLLLEKDLIDNHARTVARTALRVVIRTISSQRTKKKLTTDKPLVNLFVNIGTDLLTDQLEKADTRLCFFLPQSIHITRIPVKPGTHQLEATVMGPDGSAIDRRTWDTIAVGFGQKKFIFYPVLK